MPACHAAATSTVKRSRLSELLPAGHFWQSQNIGLSLYSLVLWGRPPGTSRDPLRVRFEHDPILLAEPFEGFATQQGLGAWSLFPLHLGAFWAASPTFTDLLSRCCNPLAAAGIAEPANKLVAVCDTLSGVPTAGHLLQSPTELQRSPDSQSCACTLCAHCTECNCCLWSCFGQLQTTCADGCHTWITQPLLLCYQWGPGEHWQPGPTAAAKLGRGSLCLGLSAVHSHADPDWTLVPRSAFAASHLLYLTAGNGSRQKSYMQRDVCLGLLK